MVAAALAVGVVRAPVDVAAHDGAARVDLDPAAVGAGGVVLVRGMELGGDGPVVLLLIDPAGHQRPLARVVADAAGEFSAPVVLPADVVPGPYTVRAIAPDGDPVDAAIVVKAASLGGGAQLGQDEPVSAPGRVGSGGLMPSGRDVVAPSPVAARSQAGDASVPVSLDPYPLSAALMAAAAVGLLVARARRPSPRR